MIYKKAKDKNKISAKSAIKWVDIILLKEFQQYIEAEFLLTLSTLSSNIRSLLKKHIFKSLLFSGAKFKRCKNYFQLPYEDTDLYFKYFEFLNELYRHRSTLDLNRYTNLELEIESSIQKLESDIQVYSTIVSNLYLSHLYTVGYYIFPTIINFTNLKRINISKCCISYNSLSILNYTLNCLRSLNLDNVIFVLLTSEKFESERIVIGKNLTKLSIHNCSIYKTDLPFEIAKFIFNTSEQKDYVPVQIPLIPVPSLIELTYFDPNAAEKWISDFLKLNPQLATLTVYEADIDQHAISAIESSDNLATLNMNCITYYPRSINEYNFPKLQSIKSISIEYYYGDDYQFTNNLILSCSNLKNLSIVPNIYSDSADEINLYTHILPKLPSLDCLSIDIDYEVVIPIDFKAFSSIERLELRIRDQTILQLELPSYKTMTNKVNIFYDGNSVKESDIKQKFEKFSNWKCRFHKGNVTCYKRR